MKKQVLKKMIAFSAVSLLANFAQAGSMFSMGTDPSSSRPAMIVVEDGYDCYQHDSRPYSPEHRRMYKSDKSYHQPTYDQQNVRVYEDNESN